LFTKTNPVRDRRFSPTLDIENFGLSSADLIVFDAAKVIGIAPCSLQKLSDIRFNLLSTLNICTSENLNCTMDPRQTDTER
jgi:hypothetical protein